MAVAALHGILAGNCNKNDLVLMLIEGCLDEGIDTGRGIVNALGDLGCNRRHVAIMLKENTGYDPERNRWCKTHDGRYAPLN